MRGEEVLYDFEILRALFPNVFSSFPVLTPPLRYQTDVT
jgi:hypothetical protein